MKFTTIKSIRDFVANNAGQKMLMRKVFFETLKNGHRYPLESPAPVSEEVKIGTDNTQEYFELIKQYQKPADNAGEEYNSYLQYPKKKDIIFNYSSEEDGFTFVFPQMLIQFKVI